MRCRPTCHRTPVPDHDDLVLSDPADVEYLTEARCGVSEGMSAGGQITMRAIVMEVTTRRGDPLEGPATTRRILATQSQAHILMQALSVALTQ